MIYFVHPDPRHHPSRAYLAQGEDDASVRRCITRRIAEGFHRVSEAAFVADQRAEIQHLFDRQWVAAGVLLNPYEA